MRLKRTVNDYYGKLSYRGKFGIIFNILFGGIVVFSILMAVYFANLLTDEIYQKNREKLVFVTEQIENDFNVIEEIVGDIHQNSIIQEALMKSADPLVGTIPSWTAQSLANTEINWLLSGQNNVSKMVLLNGRGENISKAIFDKEDTFSGRSLSQIMELVTGEIRQGRWIFQKDLQQALYVQNIFNVKQMKMEKIGTLLLFVNTSFIASVVEEADVLQDGDYFYLKDGGALFGTSGKEDDESRKLIDLAEAQNQDQEGISFVSNAFVKYFVFSKRIETKGTSFRIFYFLKNNQVIVRVISTLVLILAILILFILISYLLVNRYVDRLISPINKLVLTMKRFSGESDLKTLQEVEQPLASVARNDEIGELYGSFHVLIGEIEELVINDYQSKILARDMEFKYLQAQLDPHFLYNTLNSINGLAIEEGNFAISEMVTALAKLLRKRLETQDRFETVAEELQIVQAYVKIQSVRFANRLIYQESIADDVLSMMIPQLIIQPLIENAVKYGVEKVHRPVTINRSIKQESDKLVIIITDDGPGFDPNSDHSKKSTGLGLNNIRERIKLIYGASGSLDIRSVAHQQTQITITLPIQKERFRDEVI